MNNIILAQASATLSAHYAAEQLQEFIDNHPRLVVLTGAGISTDSGIPDYRDHNAQWKRKQPVQHHDFMNSLATRQRFWARSLIGWPVMRDAQPNQGHFTLAELEQTDRIDLLITQNVDGLHQRAGHKNIIDLHGRSDRVRCMHCAARYSRNQIHEWMQALNPDFKNLQADAAPDGDADLEDVDFSLFKVSDCPTCAGTLKPDVVFFGDNVPRAQVEHSLARLQQADGLLVIGSSLMVYSGFRFCKRAHEWHIPIAALTLGKTRADEILTLKLSTPINATLERLL
jgi:NAD-dependent SIR2 family protein deacetylase